MRLVCFPLPQLSSKPLLIFVAVLPLCFPVFLSPYLPTPSLLHVILSSMKDADIQFMQEALAEARSAATAGEVPIGAVLVHDGAILARSSNRTIRDNDSTAHAEIIVLREAARRLGNYRLAGATLYVTIEPCSMCAGAVIQARVPRLVYGADDPKGGAVRTCFQILSDPRLNHQVEVTSGVLAAECAAVIQSFFAERRQ
jgi:tRNA(Arg) A34 adenosine deaminase TadA